MRYLKDCPFCGHEAHIVNDYQQKAVRAVCSNNDCKASISVIVSKRKLRNRIDEIVRGYSYDYAGEAESFVSMLWNHRVEGTGDEINEAS